MLSQKFAIAALGIACVSAAGAGGYLATRNNVAERAAPSVAASTATDAVPSAQPGPASQAVQETEGVVGEAARASAAPAPASRPSEPERPGVVATNKQKTPPARPAPAPAASTERPKPTLDHSWPSSAPASAAPLPSEPTTTARAEERPVEIPSVPEPQAPSFEELTVAADSVVGLQTETTLSSERARVEDKVEARVVRDVRVGGRVAIPAGARALGSVVVVERGGKMRDRARLGIRFHTLALADGTRLPITTETIYRYGDAPGNGSAKKIGGGAVAGAILGAIIGGGKGAAIGATTGAAGGSAAVMAGDRSEAVFPSGAEVTARIISPVTVTVDR